MLAFPLVIMAVITAMLWLIVLIGRNCCTCCDPHRAGLCGGRYPTKGCCYGELRGADEGYSDCENRVFLFLVIAMLVIIFVGVAVGFTGNAKLSKGVNDLMDVTAAIPSKLKERTGSISTELTALQALAAKVNPYIQSSMWDNIKNGLEEVNKGADSMDGQVSTTLKVMRHYENERSNFMYIGLWIPAILSTIAIAGYLCPVLLTLLVVPLVAVITCVVWIAVGIHVPVAVSTADLCVGLDYGLKHPNASSPLDILVGCHGEAGAGKMADASTYFVEAASTAACQTLENTLCKIPSVSYPDKHGNTVTIQPVQCPAGTCNNHTLRNFVSQTSVLDFQWGCASLENGNIVTHHCVYNDKETAKDRCLHNFGISQTMPCVPNSPNAYRNVSLLQCNQSCLVNTTQMAAATVVGNWELGSRFKTVEENGLQPLVNCSFVREQATTLEHTLCWDVVEATDYVMAGLIIIAIAYFCGNFVYLMAHKRFHVRYLQSKGIWPAERDKILGNVGLGSDPESQARPLLSETKSAEAENDIESK